MGLGYGETFDPEMEIGASRAHGFPVGSDVNRECAVKCSFPPEGLGGGVWVLFLLR